MLASSADEAGFLRATLWRCPVARVLPSDASTAQFSVARITGSVIDPSGASLPGVTITATLGERRGTAVTGADGHFLFSGLPAGTYAITVWLPGFRIEHRTVSLIDSTAVDVMMQVGGIGCFDNGFSRRPPAPFLSDPVLVDPRVPARSDLVAYFVLPRRIDDDDPSECRLRYRATVLRTATSPRYGKMFLRTIDVRLEPSPIVSFNIGIEYIAWLTWRADRNAFDTGDDAEGVLRHVEDGRVKVRAETYSVDELFKIFEDLWVR